MWWIVVIAGTAFFLLRRIQAKKQNQRLFMRDVVMAKIALEWLDKRTRGKCIEEIRESLYEGFCIPDSVAYWPLFAGKMPAEAVELSEIAYTVLCHRGVYRKPVGDAERF